MSKDEFVQFVKTLRDLGAVSVEAGDLKVAFPSSYDQAPDYAPSSWDFGPEPEDEPDEGSDHAIDAAAALKQWQLDNYGSSG